MCTPPPPPPPSPPLVDDLIREILLRFPPDDPACLARARLVCKPWRGILTDAGFLRRYREFHRAPPMLGFLRNAESRGEFFDALLTARFVPTVSTFRPAARDQRGLQAIAARHGRVLLHTDPCEGPVSLVVWDPVTDERRDVPRLPVTGPSQISFNATVLCAAAGCDHLDCHGGPFAVAYVGLRNQERYTFACLYSSEAGEWGEPAWLDEAAAPAPTRDKRPGVLVGNAAYFTCTHQATPRIVEYDMGSRELSVIDLPSSMRGTMLTVTQDGKLGVAGVHKLSLYLSSREAGPDGAMAWTQRRVIDLQSMLMYFSLGKVPVWHVPYLIGFSDGVVFVMTETGRVFSVELESGRYRKTSFPKFHNGNPDRQPVLIPYMSFYTPDRATGRSPSVRRHDA